MSDIDQKPMNFEPFFDYDAVPVELANELMEAVVRRRKAENNLTTTRAPRAAGELMKAIRDLNAIGEKIYQQIFTVPVMVHIAGERQWEEEEDNAPAGYCQRCSRCGSILNFWHENLVQMTPYGPQRVDVENAGWHDVGVIVAKGEVGMQYKLYEIPKDQPLKKHERECLAMPEIDFDIGELGG